MFVIDFGRTLKPNSNFGTDHAWGNQLWVIGGAVQGGDFYGVTPVLALNGPDDEDRQGRFIPTISVEQYAATLATWFGVSQADLSYIFPYLDRFPTANLGFIKRTCRSATGSIECHDRWEDPFCDAGVGSAAAVGAAAGERRGQYQQWRANLRLDLLQVPFEWCHEQCLRDPRGRQ